MHTVIHARWNVSSAPKRKALKLICCSYRIKYWFIQQFFARRKIQILWWFSSGQVRRQWRIKMVPWTPSAAILSLPGSSAAAAVEGRRRGQRCEESWQANICNEGHLWFTILWLFSTHKPVFTLSISRSIFLTCFLSSFHIYLYFPIASSSAAVCQWWHASQISAQTTTRIVSWCFWLTEFTLACVFISCSRLSQAWR